MEDALPTEEDIKAAREGLKETRGAIHSGKYQLVILDEATIAAYYKLFSVDELLDIMNELPESVELVITGRKADPRIIAQADLVTDMLEVKHYFQQGGDSARFLGKN